jgi:excisionase family DNA binding protein
MDKKTVAERLKISTRQVEAYASQGRLGEVRYVRGRTGKQADYEDEAVERLRVELEEPDQSLMHRTDARGASGLIAPADRERFIKALELLASREETRARVFAPSIVDLSKKPLLKLDESARLTGLSKQILREAIEAKKLKAKIIGRAWRVKRADLDAYIKKL